MLRPPHMLGKLLNITDLCRGGRTSSRSAFHQSSDVKPPGLARFYDGSYPFANHWKPKSLFVQRFDNRFVGFEEAAALMESPAQKISLACFRHVAQ